MLPLESYVHIGKHHMCTCDGDVLMPFPHVLMPFPHVHVEHSPVAHDPYVHMGMGSDHIDLHMGMYDHMCYRHDHVGIPVKPTWAHVHVGNCHGALWTCAHVPTLIPSACRHGHGDATAAHVGIQCGRGSSPSDPHVVMLRVALLTCGQICSCTSCSYPHVLMLIPMWSCGE